MLLDTNILISGLIYLKGNEHQILRLLEQHKFTLILPETVIIETKRVLTRKFEGFEELSEIFLSKVKPQVFPLSSIFPHAKRHLGAVRDITDLPVYITILLTRPDYAVSGDGKLRENLRRSEGITRHTKVCSSREFLSEVDKQRKS